MLTRPTPVHVTLRMRPEIQGLRNKRAYRVIATALRAGGDRFGLRVVHHSVQSNHIHLIAEAQDSRALSRGMQGLSIRIAKGLNAHAGRHGKVLADRFHVHPLRTPRETRAALQYVLCNARKHAFRGGVTYGRTWPDPVLVRACVRRMGWRGRGGTTRSGGCFSRASTPVVAVARGVATVGATFTGGDPLVRELKEEQSTRC